MEPMKKMPAKKLLRFVDVLSGVVDGRDGWMPGTAVPTDECARIRGDDYPWIILMVAWVTVSNVVTDFALAS
jgi:hypothetical protein